MPTSDDLRRLLLRLDGRGYKAYQDIQGTYAFPTFTLHVDHVQSDPFATPSRLRVRIPRPVAAFPPDTYTTPSRAVALRDLLARQFAHACRQVAGRRGTGKSGLLTIDQPGQEILERTAVLLHDGAVEARFAVGLPARGRTILGHQAAEMLGDDLPQVVTEALLFQNQDQAQLYRHLETAEDADWLRAQLPIRGLVAFVADGAILPRRSGVDDRPLTTGLVVPFRSPASLRLTFHRPNGGPITGLGIPGGVTLIVGGGYHGKSTLLSAIERGIYDHLPGDGREFVVTDPTAVKIRAEDGRRVEKVDISPFIDNLPYG